jgi:hypothetical protein
MQTRHAGPDPASSFFWIPAFAGMTTFTYLFAETVSEH